MRHVLRLTTQSGFAIQIFTLTVDDSLAYNPPIRGCSSVVERMLPKHDIVGSSPITRSECRGETLSTFLFIFL